MNKLPDVHLAISTFLLLGLLGCASKHDSAEIAGRGVPLPLPGGWNYTVNSEPPGAEIFFNGQPKGVAPISWSRIQLFQTMENTLFEALFTNTLGLVQFKAFSHGKAKSTTPGAFVERWRPDGSILRFRAPRSIGFSLNESSPAVQRRISEIAAGFDLASLPTKDPRSVAFLATATTNSSVQQSLRDALNHEIDTTEDLPYLGRCILPEYRHLIARASVAESRILTLIESWERANDKARLPQLLRFRYDQETAHIPTAMRAEAAAREILRRTFDPLTETSYREQLRTSKGRILPEIVEHHRIVLDPRRAKFLEISENENDAFAQLIVSQNIPSPDRPNCRFVTQGARYEIWEFGNGKAKHETFERLDLAGRTIDTLEIWSLDGGSLRFASRR